MSKKAKILDKIKILITNHFEKPEDAFAFFDENGDGKLEKKELSRLLKEAEISGFIRGIVASRLIDGYDIDGDGYIDWSEFKAALDEIKE
ncbi:EF-hand domain-containing protein [Ichthyenterobacterium sp. W332]|uniref:EF-hand domain-containing protein n=1 Tax=Microcosmobacter mediterraneus TaxID=3075607 RepID=A0ABU2YMT2_9FLAO|nr:EF-hand domain-containing protein [Ichthyenterobacterium sp. W332]MDT0559475.1 EF-hand domain-containing protein [Ichthyenterobacterium sp. W332]